MKNKRIQAVLLLFVCMHVCLYMPVCVCTCIYMYVYVCICVHVSTCLFVCVFKSYLKEANSMNSEEHSNTIAMAMTPLCCSFDCDSLQCDASLECASTREATWRRAHEYVLSTLLQVLGKVF